MLTSESTNERLRMLITVKTYPYPSKGHGEVVCTAGLAEDGRWIRLFPVPFRYWDEEQQYSLYDWIELDVRKRPASDDDRKESYQPAGDLVKVGRVSTADNWRERKQLVLPHVAPSLEDLCAAYALDRTSLGIIRPVRVSDVRAEKVSGEWSPSQRGVLEQGILFRPGPLRELEKLDYKFSYRFRCEGPECSGHEMMITDWGLCYLYLKTRRDEGPEAALEKTVEKCWELVGTDKDPYFYVGTVWPHPSFIVIGMFYPKKVQSTGQGTLPLG